MARGVAVAMRLHRELAPPPVATIAPVAQVAPFPGILAAARERNFTPQTFAAATRLSPFLLSKLDGRQIAPDTVPERLIAQIAALIGRGAETVREYLAGKPQFAPQMQFRAAAPAHGLVPPSHSQKPCRTIRSFSPATALTGWSNTNSW